MTDAKVTRVPPERNRGGEWIEIGEEEYRIPPLGLLGVQEISGDLTSLQGMRGVPTKEQMGIVVAVVHSAMKRNYPKLTVEEVGEMLDLENFNRIFGAVMRIAGFVRPTPGAKDASGETGASTGQPSTSD